jgi:phosphatidylinositol 3-kinase
MVEQIDLTDKDYEALLSTELRKDLYKAGNNGRNDFQNPLYKIPKAMFSMKNKDKGGDKQTLRLKDFLVSISSFSDFSEHQLLTLEQKASIQRYDTDDIVFKQGEEGESFFVIHEGCVDVLIQDKISKLQQNNYGRVVNRLTGGCYFGERALMTSEKRAATIKVAAKTVCLVFSRATYEEVISGSNALIGKDVSDHVDWSKDHETRSLYKHVERILDIDDPTKGYTKEIKNIRYNLATIFTPELLTDEIVSRMVITVQKACKADRVGLFVLNEDRRSMVLKVSERSKGIRLPVRGLAGAIIENNLFENIVDAYKDHRFDGTMDRRTGYTTRQVLGVPVQSPTTGEAVGVLQVNNRTDEPHEAFTGAHQNILELAAEQLSELLHNRAEIFTSTTGNGAKSFGQGTGDGMEVLESCVVKTPFMVDLFTLNLGAWGEQLRKTNGFTTLEITIEFFLALSKLCDAQTLTLDIPSANISNGEIKVSSRMEFDIAVRDLPRAARILFKVKGIKRKGKPVCVGWAAAPIFDFKGCLDASIDLRLFAGDMEQPIKTTLSNSNDRDSPSVSMILGADLVLSENQMTPRTRIVHSMPKSSNAISGEDCNLSPDEIAELTRLQQQSFNPVGRSSHLEREKLWDLRYQILDRSDLLPAFIMGMQWKNSDRVNEMYALLDLWKVPEPSQALLLLDRRFMDPKVRAYAIHCLEDLDDEELSLYMLQLCQQLKFENHIDSALSRFLLRRSLRSKNLIGHIFYWQLQSEVHNIDVKRRFVILLQIYIRNCGKHRIELGRQVFVMKRLEAIAEQVCLQPSKSERLSKLRELLAEVVLPTEFQLPLNPHLRVTGIVVDKCRVMESKKKPLWLTLVNAEEGADNIVLMLKVGDDLRQDALIMQLLRVMNRLWQKEGLDMQMQLYDCISTGDERGLLQVVLNSSTIGSVLLHHTDKNKSKINSGSIFRKLSSAMKAMGDFTVIKEWIKEQVVKHLEDDEGNAIPDEDIEEEMKKRTDNFIISTAAYCVASYVLGLGDRHNDNLMITKQANFFHIDFGHILGNFKSKYGIQRERAPFVFTYAMKEVMNEKQFELFKDLCCTTYNILRQNASTLVSLTSLAIPCNLPELQTEKDVVWLYEKLLVDKTEEEASQDFRKTLDIALATRFTRLNDTFHMLAHA